jgi:hypothetical protein
MIRSLDQKLAAIRANPHNTREFILADAKDADMAFGVRAPGPRSYLATHGARPAQFSPEVWTRGEFGYRNLPEFLDIIREVTHQGLVDIMLMSAYVNEQLTIKEGLFKNSAHHSRLPRQRHHGRLGGAPRLLHARAVAAVPLGGD